jgi:hypothetical protein
MGKPRKYSDEQKAEWRAQYEKSRGGNLTSFGAMIGDQFSHRVNLLAQIIKDAHEYSLGNYKEKLLSKLIAESIPSRYAVGTGFVLFPKVRSFNGATPLGFDSMNRSDHEVSQQCDIIIYDREQYPVVFRDDDFVVVLPEATKAIVEIKGTLNSTEIKSSVDHLIDFGQKWQRCDQFYRSRHNPKLHEPSLFVLAWQIGINPDGTPQSDGKRFQEGILERYRLIKTTSFEAFPYLTSAYIYDDTVIRSTLWFEDDEMAIGFSREAGKLSYFDQDGKIVEAGDGTISGLVSSIQVSLDTPFNRFVSYKDEAAKTSHAEFVKNLDIWLRGADVDSFNWANRRKS